MRNPETKKPTLYGVGQGDLYAALQAGDGHAPIRVEPPDRMKGMEALVGIYEHAPYSKIVESMTEGCHWALLTAGPMSGKDVAGGKYCETTVRLLNPATWDFHEKAPLRNYGPDSLPFQLTASAAELAGDMPTAWELMAVMLSLVGNVHPDTFPPVATAGHSKELFDLSVEEMAFRSRMRRPAQAGDTTAVTRGRITPARLADSIKSLTPEGLVAIEEALRLAKARAEGAVAS